jgi:hypothetical protein
VGPFRLQGENLNRWKIREQKHHKKTSSRSQNRQNDEHDCSQIILTLNVPWRIQQYLDCLNRKLLAVYLAGALPLLLYDFFIPPGFQALRGLDDVLL